MEAFYYVPIVTASGRTWKPSYQAITLGQFDKVHQ